MFQRVLWSWRRRQQQQATSSRHSADQDNSPLVDNNHISTVITDIKLLNGANESRSKDHDRMEVSVAVFPSLMR